MHIANTCCHGRIVSALEGGYQLLGQNSSAFAKSVKRHVTWLTHAAVDGKVYSAEDSAIEKEYERKVSVQTMSLIGAINCTVYS
jgi:hypothetical protein